MDIQVEKKIHNVVVISDVKPGETFRIDDIKGYKNYYIMADSNSDDTFVQALDLQSYKIVSILRSTIGTKVDNKLLIFED